MKLPKSSIFIGIYFALTAKTTTLPAVAIRSVGTGLLMMTAFTFIWTGIAFGAGLWHWFSHRHKLLWDIYDLLWENRSKKIPSKTRSGEACTISGSNAMGRFHLQHY